MSLMWTGTQDSKDNVAYVARSKKGTLMCISKCIYFKDMYFYNGMYNLHQSWVAAICTIS